MYRIEWIAFKLSITTVVLILPFICLTRHLSTCFLIFLFQFHNFQNILQTSLLGQRKTKGRFSLLCRYLPSYPPSKFLPVRFPSQHTKYNHVPFRIGKINVQRRGMYALTIFVVRKKKTSKRRKGWWIGELMILIRPQGLKHRHHHMGKRSIWQTSLAKHDSQGRPPLGSSTIQRRQRKTQGKKGSSRKLHQYASHSLVPDLWQGLPCPHRSHQPPADTPLNVLKCRLTWSYS